MNENTGLTVSPERIELINSYGPYNHAVWESNGIMVTNEERLSGRGELLVNDIRKLIYDNFTQDEIEKASILDVGCYDGWILHKLSDIPFKKLVGIEPREKNIIKGQKIRELLGIDTRVEFRLGSIDELEDEIFDVVICTGLLHHLESISQAIQNLSRVCKKMLFIETICLTSKYITEALKKELELKDIVYMYKERICGLTAQKYETSYYDGSAKDFCVVNIPSLETLSMYLDYYGFDKVKVIETPDIYWEKILKDSGRTANITCLCGFIGRKEQISESNIILDYEKGLINTFIPEEIIVELYNKYLRNEKRIHSCPSTNLIIWYLNSKSNKSGLKTIISKMVKNKYQQEIIFNLKYNLTDKLRFEYAKILFKNSQYEASVQELKKIIQKINADWRSVYRAFYMLWKLYSLKGDDTNAKKYKDMCLSCNSNFPLVLFERY